jgi:hypothetical protein
MSQRVLVTGATGCIEELAVPTVVTDAPGWSSVRSSRSASVKRSAVRSQRTSSSVV